MGRKKNKKKATDSKTPQVILTAGSISRFLEGDVEVTGIVIQILACKKMPGIASDGYQLLISDGVIGYPYTFLNRRYNSLVLNKELEPFTVIRVHECVCFQVESLKVLIVLNLTVLAPGKEVGETIGNPTCLTAPSAANIMKHVIESGYVFDAKDAPKSVSAPQDNDSVQAVHPAASLTQDLNKCTIKADVASKTQVTLPNLTAGSINRILDGEEITGAIIQILGRTLIPVTSNNLYHLLISDGVTKCPYTVLDAKLNNLVTNKELENFTIVRVDKCAYRQINPDRKMIILLSLAILVPGAEVGEKIGNPISSVLSVTDATENNSESKSSFSANNAKKNVSTSQVNASVQTENIAKSKSVFSGGNATKNAWTSQLDFSVQTVCPIASLIPSKTEWTIKARVIEKTPVKMWSTDDGKKGRLFSVNFLDESGAIRATGYNDAIDKFYELFEVNKIYYVSRAALIKANKNYSTVNNDYEIIFVADTAIVPSEGNSSSIPMVQYDFVAFLSWLHS